MLELAERVVRATGSTSTVAFRPLPIDDPWHRCPDISTARALLGWEPSTPLERGLRAAAGYFRERLASTRHNARGEAAGARAAASETVARTA
jgi:UDP-glucuronate decarboxylase